MSKIYKFIAGNSRVTPIGIALAVGLVMALRHHVSWIAPLFVGVLVITLIVTTFEPVQ